jgi:hypothetical protein
MHIRKLLDWRKLLIYSYRWLGIAVGAVFVAWCISGVILMYAGVPHLTAGERLMRLPPLDLSTIRVTPAEADRGVQGSATAAAHLDAGGPGQIYKAERLDRANRWGYYGLHGLDFAFLYRYRPLWDIVAIALLVGVGVSSVTSIMPAFQRLARHARGLLAKQRHDVVPTFLGSNRRRREVELILDVDMGGRARAQQQADRLETRTTSDRRV